MPRRTSVWAIVTSSLVLCVATRLLTAMSVWSAPPPPHRAHGPLAIIADSTQDTLSELTLTPDRGPLVEQLRSVARHGWQTSRVTIVDVGAPWCVACHALDDFLHSAGMQQAMRGIQLVHLNYDFWEESLDSLAIATSNRGVPVIVVVDSAGRPGSLLRGMYPDSVRHFIATAHPKSR